MLGEKKDKLLVGQVSYNEIMDSNWLENFRMSEKRFEELVNILRPYLEKPVTRMKKSIST